MSRPLSPTLNARQFGLVCASVLAAVLPHLLHMPVWLAALIVTLLAGRWVQRQRDGRRIPAWIRLALIVLLPVLVIVHYGNVFGREPGSALACAMIVLKLCETETRRDARAAICFASFVLMSALLFNTDLAFTLILLGALALLLATLRALDPRPADAPSVAWWPALLADLRGGLFSLLAAVPLALCAFVFFPRLSTPLWRTPGDDIARTGIGDSMAPGSIQQLLIDDSPAFRVDFDGAPPPRAKLYWRGPVLTNFDGTTWTRRDLGFAHSDPDPGGVTLTRYEVTLEPTDKPWLFALDLALDTPPETLRGSDMTLMRRRPVADLLRYRVSSVLQYRLDPTLNSAQRRTALALPADFDPRSVALAQGWRRDLGKDDAVIQAALDLFHNAFFYTLAAPPLGRDSIDDFLFSTRRGFCEHYAAAFVFLMRAAGIPARVVTGYQGGYFNSVGGYLIVRQSDAHAWAEVWLAGRGWTRIDPTAAVSPQRIELGASAAAAGAGARWYQTDWIVAMRNQVDLINRTWNSVVVQFNALRQQSLLTPFGVAKADYATLIWVLVGSSGVLLSLIALWVMRTPRRNLDPLDAAYDALCRKLARAGATRAVAEGPQTYATRLQQLRMLSATSVRQAQALIEQYVSLRYASALPAGEAVLTFARGVRNLRAARQPDSAATRA
jgi:transglutaminase-like putative cysteine protease